MKVLLTGASGFIGKNVLRQLIDSNIETVVVGRVCPEKYHGQFIEADLLLTEEFDGLVRRANADHLIHLAWYAEHGLFWDSNLNLRWIESSVRLAEAFCLGGGRKIIGMGSCAEYDWSFGYLKEDDTPIAPKNIYGISKDVTRRLLHAICTKYGVGLVWTRLFFPYGIGEANQKIIPSLIEYFQGKRKNISVSVTSYRDFVHVTDVASAVVLLLKNDIRGTFNISTGKPTQIGDLVRMIARIYSSDTANIINTETRGVNEKFVVGDCSKLEALGWTQSDMVTQLKLYCDAIKC
jgi:nucleoside-diphosphate-sugar epimerase